MFTPTPRCRICGHICHVTQYLPIPRMNMAGGCTVPFCEAGEELHRHCNYEQFNPTTGRDGHGICTTVGCWPEGKRHA